MLFQSLSVFLVTVWTVLDTTEAITAYSHNKAVVCYVGSWSVYRPGKGSFSIDSIDPTLCTHLVYAFAGLNASSNTIRSLDPWQDLKDDGGKGGYERATSMKQRHPHLKITLAIGGWNEGSANYSKMASTPETRKVFIQSAVEMIRKHNFDGLDLDWEYPTQREGKPEDKQNFVSLARELKEEFKKYNLILTAALGASRFTIDSAYDVPQLSKYLDLVHMMCYDYHGVWDKRVGPNAPLFGENEMDTLNVQSTIDYMLSLGVPPHKLVMGVAFYGRTFIKTPPLSPSVHIGAAAQSQGFQGPFTRENGFMGFNEICLELSNSTSGWSSHWDDVSKTPYAVNGDKVIVYDNQRSLAEKVRFAVDRKIGGMMIWSIDTDDFQGDCLQDSDTYVDFVEDLKKLQRNPYYAAALPELNLTKGGNSSEFSRNSFDTAFQVHNGVLSMVVPTRLSSNYPLLRTLGEAAVLAERKQSIQAELEKIVKRQEKENEISQTGQGSRLSDSGAKITLFFSILLFLF